MPDLSLGPFVLESPIGTGAMGEVWKARHRDRGIPAAIKLLKGSGAADGARVESFFNEVRAVAQLDHHGIAWVFDYGTIQEEAAEASGGRLVAGSPYLVMEHASHGTLESIRDPLNWSELRAVLLALLDALAHAHAHGVIHRDLKPANVLLCARKDVRPGIKLCDFGIAFAMEDATEHTEVAGTLHYMAPEQLTGDEREQGPWTDLYALGCLAWRLLAGHPPFHPRRHLQLVLAHRKMDPPRLRTRTPLPRGFEGWLRALLAKSPADRFRCAADAAKALIDLGRPHGVRDDTIRTGIVHPVLRTAALLAPEDTGSSSFTEPTSDPDPAPSVRAPLPVDWRRAERSRPNLDLIGAGLELFGLRRPAFTGREPERNQLWAELAEVHRERRARGVVLSGTAGTGKSRLASWIAERAGEVGAAKVLTARFSQGDDADGALRTMLLRHFSALGLEADALTQRLDKVFDELGLSSEDVRRQAHAVLGGAPLPGASRYVVLRLLIEAISRERPVILVLDDLHAGLDGVRFARHVQNAQAVRPFPVLMLLMVRADLLEESPSASELATLSADPHIRQIDVEPLPREPFRELVQDLLGLEPELASLVVDRTAGNPLFAIQIVGDWVERKQLRLGSRGFKLKKGVRPQLPPDLKYVWVKRLAHVLDGLPPMASPILEAAAVLGMDVDAKEWARVADGPQGPDPLSARLRRALVLRLIDLDLAEPTEAGMHFTRGEFRNAILDRARAHKRLRAHHRAAARQLRSRLRKADLERYGRHLLAAGEREAALDPLLRAVPTVQATVGRMSAWRLLDTVEHALRRLDLPPSDERWGRLFVERATLADRLGKGATSAKFAAKAGREASRYGWKGIAAEANFCLARHAMRSGDDDMASARLVRVTNQVNPEEHPFMVGEALFLLGMLGRKTGEDRKEVARLLKSGRTWMMKDTDPRKRVQALLHLARASLEAGRPDTCAALIERSRKVANQIGDLPQQVQCLAYAAEVARTEGKLDDAAHNLRQAIDVFELIGDAQLALLRANLAMVLLDQNDLPGALQELERGLSNAIAVERKPLQLAVHAVRLRALTEAGLSNQLDDALRAAHALLDDVRTGEKDSAKCAEQAAELLEAVGDPDRAALARAVAVDQYTKLGDSEAVRRLTP